MNSKISNNNKWGPIKEWWMDPLKFSITFIIATSVTIFLVNRAAEERVEELERKILVLQAQIGWSTAVIHDFIKASIAYSHATYDMYKSVYLNNVASPEKKIFVEDPRGLNFAHLYIL